MVECLVTRNDTLRRCGLGVSRGVGFEVSEVQARSSDSIHLLLPADQDVELPASPAPCLPAATMFPAMTIKD